MRRKKVSHRLSQLAIQQISHLAEQREQSQSRSIEEAVALLWRVHELGGTRITIHSRETGPVTVELLR